MYGKMIVINKDIITLFSWQIYDEERSINAPAPYIYSLNEFN